MKFIHQVLVSEWLNVTSQELIQTYKQQMEHVLERNQKLDSYWFNKI